MANITISDLNSAELEEKYLLTELSAEEIVGILGGGPLGKLIGGIVGGIAGGLLLGPVGIFAGISAGIQLGDAAEEVL
ncbi:hypothetical protein [Moorena producens]|uniref:hypothetical protein n=1 Tax=Moorena producens TaxID=1155739 RepID=UPI003C715B60